MGPAEVAALLFGVFALVLRWALVRSGWRIAALGVRNRGHHAQPDQNQCTNHDPRLRNMDQIGAVEQPAQQDDETEHVEHKRRHGIASRNQSNGITTMPGLRSMKTARRQGG